MWVAEMRKGVFEEDTLESLSHTMANFYCNKFVPKIERIFFMENDLELEMIHEEVVKFRHEIEILAGKNSKHSLSEQQNDNQLRSYFYGSI